MDSICNAQSGKSDSIISFLRKDSSAREDALRRSNLKLNPNTKLYYEPKVAAVTTYTNTFEAQEVGSGKTRFTLRLKNTGPGYARNIEFEILSILKQGDSIYGPKLFSSTFGAGSDLAAEDFLSSSATFTPGNDLQSNDTVFFMIKYKWSNPISEIKLPKSDYIFWTNKFGFNLATVDNRELIRKVLSKSGIK